tara:strand:+ start:623 stop:847 length:225 start_codon:yes stop_codon:yes gene_type:complete
MTNKVMTITTRLITEETSIYKIPLDVWEQLKQAKTQEEKRAIYNELPFDDFSFIENTQDEFSETEQIDWGIHHE